MANEFIVRKGLIVEGASGGTVVDIQGSQGQLFSVTDDLSGSIFAVSDISGVPIFDVNSSGVSYFDGKVGIGTSNPSAAIHVYDQNSGEVKFERATGYAGLLHFGFPSGLPSIRTSGNFAIKASNTWGADLYIKSDGNVGIGTTNPGEKLTIGDTGNVGMSITDGTHTQYIASIATANAYGNGSTIGQLYLRGYDGIGFSGNQGGATHMTLLTGGNVGIGTTPTASGLTTNLEMVGGSTFASRSTGGVPQLYISSNGVGQGYTQTYKQDGYATQYVMQGFDGTHLFSTAVSGLAGGTITYNPRLVILNNGNVGIGTTAPVKKLQVSDSATGLMTNLLLTNTHDTNGDTAGISFSMTDNDLYNKAGIVFERTTAQGIGKLYLCNNNTGDSSNFTLADAAITIIPDGNVGIGTTAPGTKLDVDGSIRLSTSGRVEGRSYPYTTNVGSGADATTTNITAGSTANLVTSIDLAGSGATNPKTIIFKTSSTERMRIASDGNVGIGATPEANMVSYIKQLRLGEQSALQGHTDGVGQDSATWLTTNITFTSTGGNFINGTVANPGYAQQYQQQLGDHSFATSNATGVAGGAITLTQQMVIKQNGNVGINTTSPNEKLQVVGNIQGGGVDQVSSEFNAGAIFRGQNDGAAYINLIAKDTANSGLLLGVSASGVIDSYVAGLLYSNATNSLNIHVNNQNAIVIDSSQRVGINESAPTERLHVDGNARVTGAYYDSGNSQGTAGQVLSSTGSSATNWVDNNVSNTARADMFEIDNVAITSQGQGANINATQILTAGNVTRTAQTQMEVQTDGQYAVNFTFYLRTDYSVRQTMGAYLEVERIVSGETAYIVVPGSLAATYTRITGTNPGDQSSVTNSFFCDLKADDVLVLKLGRTDVNINPISIGIVYPSGPSGTTGWPPTSTGNSKHHIAFRRVAVLT